MMISRQHLLKVSMFTMLVSCVVSAASVDDAQAGLQRPAMTLLAQSSVVSGVEGSSFQMSLLLSNPLVVSADETTRLVITSHRPVSSRADVRTAIEGELPQIIDAVTYPLSDLLTGSANQNSTRIDLIVPTEIGRRTPDALQMSAVGVYPLSIDIEIADARVLRLVSFIERLGPRGLSSDETSPLDLALVGRLGPPVNVDRGAAVAVSRSSRQLMSEWVSLLERRPDFLATIAAQPEFFDSFSRSIPEDRELLIRLQRAAAFDIMSTTFVAMDPSDTDRNGLTDVFTRQLRLGESALTSLFPARVAPRHSWLASNPLSAGGARVLADLGFRTVVLPSTHRVTVEPDPLRLVELSFSDEGSVLGVVVDESLAAALQRGSSRPTGGEHLTAQQVLADLKAFRSELAQRGVDPMQSALVLTGETGELPSAALADALWDVVTRDPRFAFTSLDGAITKQFGDGDLERVDITDSFDDSNPFPASGTLGSVLRTLQGTIDAFGSMLPSGDERVREWRRVLDVLPDNRLTASQRQGYVDTVRFSTQEIASSVLPPAATTFTLGGRESPIRFSIRNDQSSDLEIRVRLTSSKLRLPEGDKLVTLPAGTSTAVEFAVSARTNGRFPVTLQLLTPQGDVLLGPPSTLTARVNALAGLGQLVTGIALLFLATWWANHFRQQYRRRQSEAGESSQRHPSGERSA